MTHSSVRSYWTGMLALVTACAPVHQADHGSEVTPTTSQELIMAAIEALPLDSLCASASCKTVALDTVVRFAPSRNALHLESLKPGFTLSASAVRANWRRSVALVLFAYPAEEAVSSGSAAIGLALVGPAGAQASTATVLVTIRMPNSYGTVALLDLRLEGTTWVVTSVEYREA